MQTNVYRVHHDSSHFVGVKYFKKYAYEDDLDFKNYKSEFAINNHISGKKKKKIIDENIVDRVDVIMEEAYLKALEVRKHLRVKIMQDYLKENNVTVADEYVELFLQKKYKNLQNRIDRFRKKALLNNWNYFVTITYDDLKHDEESFKTKLKKCLANLHDRGGYRYMGVFERSKTGRLHFHCLMYIPTGEMRGNLKIVRDYSTSDHKMRVTFVNTFFEERFGRNDFTQIDSKKLMKDRTIDYLLKYIAKSDEAIFYSRGIPTYLFYDLPDNEVITSFGKFVVKYVLTDEIVENYDNMKMRC